MESKNAAMKKRNKMGNLMGGAQGMQAGGLGQLMGMNMGGGLGGMNMGVGLGGMNTNMAAMMTRSNPQKQYKQNVISNNMLRTGSQIKN